MLILKRLEKSRAFWFLLATSIVFFFLRLPSLFEPYWYGDEGIYQALGLGINEGKLLYRDIFDNKPPLLYYLYGFFNSEQFLLRAANLIFGILTLVVFFKLAQKILKKESSIYISTFLFAVLFGVPLLEGNIANSENFMLLFNCLSGLLVLYAIEAKKNISKILFGAGLVVGISFLFKIVALFDFAAFFIFVSFVLFDKDLKKLKPLLPFSFGFIIPITLSALYFFASGAFSEFLRATFSNNVGYVGWGNRFIIPQGLLYLKIGVLLTFVSVLFWKRNILDKKYIFVFLWVAFSLFNALFAQRPYTHYVLVTLPSFLLLLGLVIDKGKNFLLSVSLLLVSLFLILSTFSFSLKTVRYYPNYISFIFGGKSVYDYQRFFDRNTPRDYLLSAYIKANTKDEDNIFIWGNNAQVYKLTDKLPPGRYTVAYHISNYKDGYENTENGLERDKPKFIIVMNNVAAYPFSLAEYSQRIKIEGVDIYERIY